MPKPKNGFKPKNNANPNGRPKLDKDVQEASRLTKTMILEILTQYMSMDVNSLKVMLQDPTKPVIHHIVGRVALKAINSGDHQRLDFFMNRMIGKVTDKVEHSLPRPVIIDCAIGLER